ncbi:unnamed protein product [Peniophora sp. CBMAI 1063]|nr:unnamed protein product [Peniophora sp. CBMAI 1063]
MRLQNALPVVALAAVQPALAWGAAGHEIVATLAQMHLHPPVLPVICSILYPTEPAASCSLASVATWADKIRFRARWSAPLHYVGGLDDYPPDSCEFPGTRGWAGKQNINVLGGIRNVTNILTEFVSDNSARGGVQAASASELELAQEALKFLIHFLGDVHQPLHLTGRDRGGNSVKVSWNGRVTNLHSLWDGLLIAKALRSIPRNYTVPLPVPPMEAQLRGTIYDPYIRRIMWDGIGLGSYSDVPGRWEDELEDWLACPAAPAQTQGFFSRAAQFVLGSKSLETDDQLACPRFWAGPIHELNCDFIWPHALDPEPHHSSVHEDADIDDHAHEHNCEGGVCSGDEEMHSLLGGPGNIGAVPASSHYLELDTPEYSGAIAKAWVVEKLLAQGGIRLAAMLNEIFEPLVEQGSV